MKRRRFTQDFKRSIVEQLLSETTGPAELCRRCNTSSGQLNSWKRQYTGGKLDPEPSREADLRPAFESWNGCRARPPLKVNY